MVLGLRTWLNSVHRESVTPNNVAFFSHGRLLLVHPQTAHGTSEVCVKNSGLKRTESAVSAFRSRCPDGPEDCVGKPAVCSEGCQT